MPLGWAIISTGTHPDQKVAPAINAAPSADLVAVYSRDQSRADAFAEKHGAKAAYSSVEGLLGDSRVDAVFVCSPNAFHARHAVQSAQAGKHVLSEKPMTTTLEDAVEMVRACQQHGVKLGVGYHLRRHPGHQLVRRAVAQGDLGRITLAQAQWGFGVRGQEGVLPRTGLRQWWDQPELVGEASTMMGTGVHAVDLLRYLLDQEVTEVAAITDGQRQEKPLEQVAALSLRFDGGTVATVCCGRLLPDSRNDFTLYGSLGRAVGTATLWEARQGRLDLVSDSVSHAEAYSYSYLANFVDELEDFCQAVEKDGQPAATGVDGLRVVEVTLAMIESARHGRTVRIEPAQV